jgi:hypothetical protein
MRLRRWSRSAGWARSTLHADFHANESPNGCRPMGETVFADRFGLPAFAREKDAA